MNFWNFVNKSATETEPESVELRIDGDIVDDENVWLYHWFEEPCASPNVFREELSKYNNKPLTVWINSYGGNVFAASGIFTSLKEHKGGVTVKIDGKAMSAASVIAMAGDKILMSPTAIIMIHNPLTGVYGYASDLRKAADVLDEVKECIINAYAAKTGRSRSSISTLMDGESYMSAKTAVKEKFADGMLYADDEAKPIEMAFDRTVILNSTIDAMKRMVAKHTPQKPDNSQALALLKLQLEL
jgi:ATP-dependent Clp protease, protease subunit